MNYETVIGLEVHAQLATNTKIFCGCKLQFGSDPNTQTCPVCLGMPGVLPVLNKRAVEYAVRMGLAVHCDIHEQSIFARKNYFYPDLPKGYQISQYEEPLCEAGHVDVLDAESNVKKIRINRIHMEEDAGKSVHDEVYIKASETGVDLNRCGTPLIEIVSEPDLSSAQEAAQYLTKIRQMVRWLGVCDGNMEEGSLRCDANISLRPVGETKLGTKTELKNMNSIRNVERAIEVEIKRQKRKLNAGEAIVQETLLWDEAESKVRPMRSKEEAHDYRYFPEPDLIPLTLNRDWIEEVRDSLPEMPEARMARWMADYEIPEYDAGVLSSDKALSDFYDVIAKSVEDPKQASNWVMGEVMRILNDEKWEIEDLKASPENLVEIINLVNDGTISNSAGKKVLAEVARTGEAPKAVVEKLGLVQVSDSSELEGVLAKILDDHPDELARYLGGKTKLFGFFVGQAMKATKGKANPQMLNELLKKMLEERA